jgi:hypothetical protein
MASSSGAFDVSQHQTYRIDAMDFMHFGCGSAALKTNPILPLESKARAAAQGVGC